LRLKQLIVFLVALQVLVVSSICEVATVLLDLVYLIFFLFLHLHVITDRLDDGEIRDGLLSDSLCMQKSHWIIIINGNNYNELS